jgi:hypothetical protein
MNRCRQGRDCQRKCARRAAPHAALFSGTMATAGPPVWRMLLSSEGVLHTFKLEASTINSAASFARVRLTISLKNQGTHARALL